MTQAEMQDGDYQQQGYLNRDFRFFHICDRKKIDFSYHYHEFDKIILFLRGNARYIIEGREYELKPYDFVLVNRYDIHKAVVDFTEDYERIILYIRHDFLTACHAEGEHPYSLADCLEEARKRKMHVVRFPANISADLYNDLQLLDRDIAEEDRNYAGELLTRTDLIRFLIRLNAACMQGETAFHPEARYNRKIIDIIEYIMEHLGDDLSIDEIADRFYISKYHMMRIFKADTGYSIHQYISEKRILMARNLILEGMPATSASLESGFRDYSSFCRAFKKQLDILPSELKNDLQA
ncbi:MAG: helix-turn-helix domain-containing protein [Butyrivibrio sp.]|nr:helix-turn-helix domain-containing protein [Butyrivibrio sp.]